MFNVHAFAPRELMFLSSVDIQRHNALINDIQRMVDEDGEVTPEPREQEWKSNSQYTPFSTDATSAAQVPCLSSPHLSCGILVSH